MDEPKHDIDTLLGIQTGITITLAALVSTHPNYEALQLKLAALIEHVAPTTLWPTLSERQREVAEKYVEFLQQIEAAPPGTDPLTRLGIHWRG